MPGAARVSGGRKMRVKPSCEAGACRPSTLSDKRSGAIARRAAILLSGTAAIALSIAEPANAIVINDQVAAAVGGIANYYDQNNQFPYVVSLFSASLPGSQCTGSLINSRTILTAAHCFLPNNFGIPSISFAPTFPSGFGITSFVRRPDFVPLGGLENDIAVISLAQPVTNVAPVRLLTLQPGQSGFPTAGTTITMAGYGTQGTGSGPEVGVVWRPNTLPGGIQLPSPIPTTEVDDRRRVATSSLGLYGPIPDTNTPQPFFNSQFRNPLSTNNPNFFRLQVPTTPLEGG